MKFRATISAIGMILVAAAAQAYTCETYIGNITMSEKKISTSKASLKASAHNGTVFWRSSGGKFVFFAEDGNLWHVSKRKYVTPNPVEKVNTARKLDGQTHSCDLAQAVSAISG